MLLGCCCLLLLIVASHSLVLRPNRSRSIKMSTPRFAGRKLPGSSLSSAAVGAAVSVGVVLPIWITTLIPLAIVDAAVTRLKSLVFPPPETERLSYFRDSPGKSITRPADALDSKSPRELDLVVYGATGFTGGLLTRYLAKNYGAGSSLKWGIAGRNKKKLEEVRSSLGPDFSNLKIIVADSMDVEGMTSLVRRTKCVASTAGPFSIYSNLLVASCVQQGTDYCDITGEMDWVKVLIDRYDNIARESGARIVNCCGHDCVPWDLSVHMAAEEFKKRGWGALKEVNCYDIVKAKASGGTMTTMMKIMNDPESGYSPRCGFNPLDMLPNGSRSPLRFSGRPGMFVSYSPEAQAFTSPFVMAFVNAQSIHRSNALNGYADGLIYRESRVHPNVFAAITDAITTFAGLTALAITPLRWLLVKTGGVPSPGEGPTEEEMDGYYLTVDSVASGVGADGVTPVKLRQALTFNTDPGYRDTARMLAESALTLILDGDKAGVSKTGGVITPSAACGSALLNRLVQSGCEYSVD